MAKKPYTAQQAYRLAHSAGWDAGNRSMVASGRSSWSDEDWNVAAETFEKVFESLV